MNYKPVIKKVAIDKPLLLNRFFRGKQKPAFARVTIMPGYDEQDSTTADYVLSGKAFDRSEDDAIITSGQELQHYLDSLKS